MSQNVRTLLDLRNEVLSWLDEGSGAGSTLTNVNAALNQAHKLRLTKDLWPFMLWDTAETFTLTAGTRDYVLHSEFHRPFYFFNRTRKKYLRELGARSLEPSGVKWNTDQDTDYFALWGRSPVLAQPASATTLTIVSTSVADTGADDSVTIRGIAGGLVTSETINPNGTSAVAGTTSFTKILGVTLDQAWQGTLTLATSGGTTLLTLPAGEYGRSFQNFNLLSAPSSADVIEYRFYRLPKPLVSDRDTTDLPPGHEGILVWDALLLLAAYDGRLDSARAQEWGRLQAQADLALRQATLEIQPIGAEPLRVRPSDDDFPLSGPLVWVS